MWTAPWLHIWSTKYVTYFNALTKDGVTRTFWMLGLKKTKTGRSVTCFCLHTHRHTHKTVAIWCVCRLLWKNTAGLIVKCLDCIHRASGRSSIYRGFLCLVITQSETGKHKLHSKLMPWFIHQSCLTTATSLRWSSVNESFQDRSQGNVVTHRTGQKGGLWLNVRGLDVQKLL